MKTHNSQKYGRKHKKAKAKMSYERQLQENKQELRLRQHTRGYLTLLGVVLAAMVVTAFLSPKAQAFTSSSVIQATWVLDDCGRVQGTAATPEGVYISPEECKQIRLKAQKAQELAEQDRTNFILSIVVAIFAVIIGISLYRS